MSLEVKNVFKSYTQGNQNISVLKGLSFAASNGEIIAIVGQSGSGKSTLLSLLSGLDSSDQGQIIINGTDINKLDERQRTLFRAKNIGIVFQQFHLISHLSAQENVQLACEIAGVKNEPEKLLQRVGLGHRVGHFPSQLSGGECQRVAIARALSVNPKILLADEPSGNLDEKTGKSVMDLLFEQVRKLKTTTVLVTHNAELAKRCDRILILEDGKV
jgi:putative ABC transport system ATP-binding protein